MNNLNSFYLLTGLFMVVSTVMILVILMQRPKGGGLSAAFGGSSAGSADSLLGGRVGDTLTWVTVVAFVLYLGLARGFTMTGPLGPPKRLKPPTRIPPLKACQWHRLHQRNLAPQALKPTSTPRVKPCCDR